MDQDARLTALERLAECNNSNPLRNEIIRLLKRGRELFKLGQDLETLVAAFNEDSRIYDEEINKLEKLLRDYNKKSST